MIKKKILVVVNSDWFFLLHMFPIIKALEKKGCDIFILAPDTGKSKEITKEGFYFMDLKLDRKGVNPLNEISALCSIYKIYKKVRPDIVHHITIKPIVYGSIAAKLLKIPVINTICGLGYSFVDQNNAAKKKLAFFSYKKALSYKKAFHFFENKNDRDFFITNQVPLSQFNSKVVNGVGSDLTKYSTVGKLGNREKVIITMASRMLWEKGVREFVYVAKSLYRQYDGKVEFRLYGKIDDGNPGAVPKEYLKNIEILDYLKWYGFESDMLAVYQKTDIIVLPSFYREGCPMVLMEACAMGKPIVTSDSIGCRECVEEGVNGFKVPVKSVPELTNAIEKLIKSQELRIQFGFASRRLAERKFDQKRIIKQYLDVFNKMLQ